MTKLENQNKKFRVFLLGIRVNSLLFFVCFVLLFLPLATKAVTLYLEPETGQYQPGDTFVIEVKIDTEGECINAVEANLSFSNDILQAIDFSRGESILSLWVKNPEINQGQGLVSFSGGTPGGYCGRIPGDPGTSNSLGKIIFRVPGMTVKESRENKGEIKFLESSQVLLNDGFGTPAKLTTKATTIKITEVGPLKISKNEWQKELAEDKIPPEPFEIKPQRDPLIFEGKYFIAFLTTDKQTGIDYYEVCEHTKLHECEHEKTQNWKKAESPYLLEDQSLKSIIKVKAVDKAGNERFAEYLPEISKKPFPWQVIILVGAAITLYLIIKKGKIVKRGEKGEMGKMGEKGEGGN